MTRVKSLFISDVHLGTRACQAGKLTDFLREHPSDTLYLVGDIIDFWAMSRSVFWNEAQNTFVQKVLKRARHGCKVVFIPGNHDELLRDHIGSAFGGITLASDCIHEAVDGRRFLVTHGDQFDQVTRHHRWAAVLGDKAYDFLVNFNLIISWVRRRLGLAGYWSLAGYMKRRVKTAVSFIFDYEQSVIQAAAAQNLDGVICGHIHWPEMRDIDGLTYINCGDWVDSCTGVVEHLDGRFEIVHWQIEQAPRKTADTDADTEVIAEADADSLPVKLAIATEQPLDEAPTPNVRIAFPAMKTLRRNGLRYD